MVKIKFHPLHVKDLKLVPLAGLCSETVSISNPIVPGLGQPLITAALGKLDTDTVNLIKLIDRSHTSPLTPEVQSIDRDCDNQFAAIKRGITYYSKDIDAEKVAAAKLLMSVFKPMWYISSEPISAQFTMLDELNERITASFDLLAALTTIGLDNNWGLLKNTYHALQDVYERRLDDDAATALPAASGMKATVVKEYDGYCILIEQMMNVLPSATLEKLFHEMNELRKKYVVHLPKNLAAPGHCVIEDIPTQWYTGKVITPIPKAYYLEEGKPTVELFFPTDFTVTYESNKEVGMANATIHGKGHYKGQKNTTFKIVRRTND
jgi:hypothetical protein